MENKAENHFLMRKITYSPDYVSIHCDMKIRWLQELYFESIILMPEVILSENRFVNYKICDTYISVDLDEWNMFFSKMTSAFRNNKYVRKKITKNIQKKLENYDAYLSAIEYKFEKSKKISHQEITEVFNLFAQADAFAVFNMLIPFEYYKKSLVQCNITDGLSIDDVMLCMFEPHRLLVRKNKLLLAKKMKKEEITDDEMDIFLSETLIYDEFENWIFDISKLEDRSFIKRELKNICKTYTEEELTNEIELIENNRKEKIQRTIEFLNTIQEKASESKGEEEVKNILDMFLFLITITTEEEKRHMIECRNFIIFGKIFKNIDIDPARSEIKEIKKAVEGFWKEV